MAITLKKGQKVDLTKSNPGLSKILVGLGWDVNKYDGGSDFDLDASVFMLGADGKVPSENEFIFYNSPKHVSGSVEYMGDNRTGEGEGDDEQVKVNLSLVPANIEKIAFTVTIYDYEARKQNFGQVSNAFIRIVDETNNQELIRYDLSEDFSIETALVIAELYRNNGEWKVQAIGSGFNGGLEALCGNFGLNLG
jgi:tellurium resistance protein TerD